MQEEDDAGLPVLGGILLPVAEQLGQEHQVVVVHPHHVVAVPPLTDESNNKKTHTHKRYSSEATSDQPTGASSDEQYTQGRGTALTRQSVRQ